MKYGIHTHDSFTKNTFGSSIFKSLLIEIIKSTATEKGLHGYLVELKYYMRLLVMEMANKNIMREHNIYGCTCTLIVNICVIIMIWTFSGRKYVFVVVVWSITSQELVFVKTIFQTIDYLWGSQNAQRLLFLLAHFRFHIFWYRVTLMSWSTVSLRGWIVLDTNGQYMFPVS